MGMVNKRNVTAYGQTYEVRTKAKGEDMPFEQKVGSMTEQERRDQAERNSRVRAPKPSNKHKKARGVYGD